MRVKRLSVKVALSAVVMGSGRTAQAEINAASAQQSTRREAVSCNANLHPDLEVKYDTTDEILTMVLLTLETTSPILFQKNNESA
jgi:hypothetical protein